MLLMMNYIVCVLLSMPPPPRQQTIQEIHDPSGHVFQPVQLLMYVISIRAKSVYYM